MFDARESLIESLAIAGLTLVFYLLTTAGGYVGGDHGIFAIVTAEHGYGHAPGYPLFSILLSALSWIPGENWFEVSSRITALIAALSVGASYLAGRAWGAHRYGAAVGAFFFGFAPHVWYIHTQAEVFALNHLIVASILAACGPGIDREHIGWAGVLGLLFGLGASHHHTAVFMVPLGFVALLDFARRNGIRSITYFVLGFVAGLIPMAWLVWVAESHPERWHWGDPTTVEGFIHLFLRRDYGTWALTIDAAEYSPFDQILFGARSYLEEFTVLGAFAAILGIFLLPFRREKARSIALVISLILSGPLFWSLLGRAPEGPNYLLVRKFHLLFELVAVVPLALGFDRMLAWIRPRWRVFASVAAFVLLAILRLPGQASEDRSVQHYCEDLWAGVGSDAVIIGPGDHNAICSEYLLRTETDLNGHFVAPHLLVHDWYRQRIQDQLKVEAEVEGTSVEIIGFIRDLQKEGFRVHLTGNFHPDILRTFPSYPCGLTIALMAEGERPLAPLEAAAENAAIFEQFELAPLDDVDPRRDPWRYLVQKRYAATWELLGHALRQEGNLGPAGRAEEMSELYAPGKYGGQGR